MSNLLLKNLEIRSFRGFRHLKLERLGRVNLIVGKNNVGKTALLEALRLYAAKGSPEVIWELLGTRNERRTLNGSPLDQRLSALKYLFYGRRELKESIEPIRIGPIDALEESIFIRGVFYIQRPDESGRLMLQLST